jgi:transcriptional regulator with XRE-family HTH domain
VTEFEVLPVTANMNSVGDLIREWRARRRMSQFDLASEADISQRHLSFLESGRAAPSRDMVIRLADGLDVPLRHRNRLLLAAGFAPHYSERPLTDPSLSPALETVKMVLKGHEPFPAFAVDSHWNMVTANNAVGPLIADIKEPALLDPPVNVMRLCLHPAGLASRIVNLTEWRAHLLARLKQQNETFGDPSLEELERELRSYPGGISKSRIVHDNGTAIAHMLRLRAGADVLSFISTITVFGTALDVTLSELAIESFFPADPETSAILAHLAKKRSG